MHGDCLQSSRFLTAVAIAAPYLKRTKLVSLLILRQFLFSRKIDMVLGSTTNALFYYHCSNASHRPKPMPYNDGPRVIFLSRFPL